MNYFASASAAERYSRGRPYFHPLVIDRIPALTGRTRFACGIDVCCGTGLSTRALKEICDVVAGTDLSQEMIDQAPASEGISYHCGPAENLPFPADSFDLMTVALGFHWLDRPRFLSEAHRVLRKEAWLVIYQNGFGGTMRGNSAYEHWNREGYVARYPVPPRNHAAFTKNDAAEFGFDFPVSENYANDVDFSVEELACYLSTQSNMIAAIENGRETAESAMTWLIEELEPLFTKDRETFPFGGSIWILQRRDDSRCGTATLAGENL